MYLIYLGIYVLYLILILVGRYCVPQLIRMSSFRYWTLCIVTVVLPIYSLIVISIGTFHNVIFEATTFQEILVSMVGLNDSWQINENRTLTYINNADHDYYVSLVASAIDNITFFLCLGLLTLLIGMRNPKNDTIHNRVEYLLSAEKIDPAARANAVRSIEKLACYNESTEVHLIIEDAEPQNNILKIPPDMYKGGWEYYRLICFRSEDLKNLCNTLEEKKFPYEILRKKLFNGSISSSLSLTADALFADLTEKQMDAVLSAFNQGYYGVPRKTDVKTIARRKKVPRTTFTEHLRKAENRLINQFLAGY